MMTTWSMYLSTTSFASICWGAMYLPFDVLYKSQGVNKKGEYYDGFYYPVPSKCYAFQPRVAEGRKLADKFSAHHWWLPNHGERNIFAIPVGLYFYKNDEYNWQNSVMYRAIEDKVFPAPVLYFQFAASSFLSVSTDWMCNVYSVNANNSYGGSTYTNNLMYRSVDFSPICKF